MSGMDCSISGDKKYLNGKCSLCMCNSIQELFFFFMTWYLPHEPTIQELFM